MMIGEIGSTEYGGSKAAWISGHAGGVPPDYPKISGLLCFETYDGGMDWPIETSSSSGGSVCAGIQAQAFRGAEYGGLNASPDPTARADRGPGVAGPYTLSAPLSHGARQPEKQAGAHAAGARMACAMALALALVADGLAATPASGGARRRHQPRPQGGAQHRGRRRAYWGAWIGEQLTGEEPPWDMRPVAQLESILGKGMSLVGFGSTFADCSPAPCTLLRVPDEAIDKVHAYGAIPFFNWSSQESAVNPSLTTSMPDFQLSDILAGRYDPYIRASPNDARQLGSPVLPALRLGDERQLVPLGRGRQRQPAAANTSRPGATCTTSSPPSGRPTPPGSGARTPSSNASSRRCRRSIRAPYVDWTCMDGYNWGSNPTNPHKWRTFDSIFSSTYRRLVKRIAPDKPIVLARDGLHRRSASEGEMDQRHVQTACSSLPQGAGTRLVRPDRPRHRLAAGELGRGQRRLRTGHRKSRLPGQRRRPRPGAPLLPPS